jgi:hypothetical protein
MISRFAKCSAAGVLLLVSASPGLAAETIRNPGTFNFYYPNRDPLNGGVPTPASRMESDPAAMQAHARRESGIDNRIASTGFNRAAFGASRANLKSRTAASTPNVAKAKHKGVRSVAANGVN